MSSILWRSTSNASKFFLRKTNKIFFSNQILKNSTASSIAGQKSEDKLRKFTEEDEAENLQKLKLVFDEEVNQNGIVPVFKRALLYGNKTALKDVNGEYSYSRIYNGAKNLSIQISNLVGSASNSRVAFCCPNDVTFLLSQWACWFSGQVSVPLSPRHPAELLEYYIKDSDSALIVTTPEFEVILKPIADKLNKKLIIVDQKLVPELDQPGSWLDPKNENIVDLNGKLVIEGALDSHFYANSNATILYTSGSTAKPKGVVLTHKNIDAQINCLVDAWKFNQNDCLLHVLPLNHVHGLVNALLCPLYVGGKTIMLPFFDGNTVWSKLLNVNTKSKDRINMLMGVPTIYKILIEEYKKIFSKNPKMCEYIRSHCETKIRLMVSGSAPLPAPVFHQWRDITGHRLLERYGMTEVGMAISNTYIEDKIRKREPGSVGMPLPGVGVKIADPVSGKSLLEMKGESSKGFWRNDQSIFESDSTIAEEKPISGDLYVKGANVFKEYFGKPEETKKDFIHGWFKTGDSVCFENNTFKILGRTNVDIIKSGGFKISALQIETYLLEHPSIGDVAVVGLPDVTWGQKVAAIIVPNDKKDIENELELNKFKEWCLTRMASYSVPTVVKFVDKLPRNPMGKLNKKDLLEIYFTEKDERAEK